MFPFVIGNMYITQYDVFEGNITFNMFADLENILHGHGIVMNLPYKLLRAIFPVSVG